MTISVLISVYAGADPTFLRQALQSIEDQTQLPDEVVLMEDGPLTTALDEVIADFTHNRATLVELSPDDTASEVEQKRETACALSAPANAIDSSTPPTVPYVIGRFAKNVQLGRALAFGTLLCRGPYIARMDADDIALPDRLEKQLAYLKTHPAVAVLGGAIEEFDGDTVKHIKTIPSGNELIAYAKYRCPVNHMTVMMKRDEILRVGNYHHFPGLEDYELWSRALVAGVVFDNISDVLVRARCDSGFYGRRGGSDYGKRYLKLRKEQLHSGLLSTPQYIKACAATVMMVYAPASLRKVFYTLLRRRG